MSSSAYPSYRESHLHWAPFLPSHWSSARLRWLASRYAGGTPNKNREDFWDNGTIPWLNSGSVNQGLIQEPSAFITDEAFANSSTRWVPAGALLMALAGQGKTKGMAAQLAFRATCNQSMAAIVPGDELESRYLLWWLSANYQNIRNLAGGDNRDGLNLELLGDIQCPLPSVSEQVDVAAFLDRETAKIDVLVEEQRRLIELLKEKRQAVISHAVTKGLNPTAPMKDSGVEWLGAVPAHWDVVTMKRVISLATSGPRGWSELASDEGEVFFQSQNIGRLMEIDLANGKRIDVPAGLDAERARLAAGDVVVCITGGRTGAVAAVRNLPETCYINQHVCLLRPVTTDADGSFLAYGLFGRVGQEQLALAMYGLKQGLGLEDVKEVLVALAPLAEQRDVVAYLDRQTEQMDKLVAEAESAIAILNERRAALISAAVTGKIDVRGVATQQAEAA